MSNRPRQDRRKMGTWARWDDRVLRVLAPQWSLSPVWRYSLAVATAMGAVASRWALIPLLGMALPHTIAIAAVAVTTALFGLGPGLLCVLVAGVGDEVFVLRLAGAVFGGAAAARVGGTVVAGVLLSLVVHAVRVAQRGGRESAARLATTLASIGDAVIATDAAGAVTFVNPTAEALTGWGLAEAMGKPVGEVFHIVNEQTRQEAESPVARVLREGTVVGLANHTVLVRADGTEVPIDDSGAPIRDERGALSGVVLVFRDISERRKAERQVAWLASFPEQNQTPVMEVEASGRVHYANPAARAALPGLEARGLEHPWFAGLPEVAAALGEGVPYQTRDVGVGESWYQQTISVTSEGRLRIYAADVTARRQAEEALARERAVLDAVIHQMPAGLSVMDRAGEVVLTNERALEMLGQASLPGDVQERGRRMRTRRPDGQRYELDELPGVRALRSGEAVREEEILVTRSDGKEAVLLVSCSPLRDEGGHVTGVVTTYDDLTARRQTEQALARERALLEAVVRQMPVGLVALDGEGRVILRNAQAEQISRVSAYSSFTEAYQGSSKYRRADGTLYQAEDLPALRALRYGETTRGAPMTFATPEGEEVWLFVNASPLLDAGGRVAGSVSVYWDVTEQKRAEQALRESEARFRLALKNSPVSVAAQDRDLRYVWAYNQRSAGPDQIIGRFDHEIFTAEEAAHITAMKRRVLEEGIEQREQLWLDRPTGRMYLDVCWEPIRDQAGRIIGVASATVDLTPIRLAEEALRRSEARWNAAIESFADGAIIATEDEQVIYWNPAAREMHGFAGPDEGIGPLAQTPLTFQLWTPDGSHRLELDEWPMRRVRRGETVRNLELRIRRPDQGWEKVFSYSGTMVDTAGGERLIFLTCQDLTELRKAEQALRDSERRLIGVLESMPDAFVSFDADMRYRYVNANAERLQATTREELLGKQVRAVYPDAESDRTISQYERVVREQKPETSTSYYAGFDRWVEVRAFPTPDGVSVFYKDVSAQVRAEQALRESEARLRRIARAGRIGFVEWNASKDTSYWSPEHYELFGYHPGSPITWERWLQGVHPQDRERVAQNAARLLARGRAERQVRGHRDEYRYHRPGGAVVWLESDMSLDMVDGEAIIRGTVRDITERKQAEQERERLHARVAQQARLLDTIVTGTDSRLAYLDRDLRYVRVNAAYAAAARMAPEEFVGRHRLEVFPNAPEVAALYRRVLDTGEPSGIAEYTGVPRYRPEAGLRTVRIDAAPVRDGRGEVEGVVTSMVDITDQVRQRQQVVEAERARAQLAETLGQEIAHRTKNNLAIVAGLLQLQLDRDAAPDAHAGLIRDAVTRIMSFAALHEQMHQRHSDAVELLDALRRIADIDRQALSTGRVTISVEGEPVDYPSRIATNLCVVANELITNAIKHGGLQEAPGRVEVHLGREGGRLALSVWNSGAAVAADFDIKGGSRTGLGLVRTIVEDQYGGSFTLAPDRGGTRARILLDEERLVK